MKWVLLGVQNPVITAPSSRSGRAPDLVTDLRLLAEVNGEALEDEEAAILEDLLEELEDA